MLALTVLSVVTLVGIADGVYRVNQSNSERQRREDLYRRGFIL